MMGSDPQEAQELVDALKDDPALSEGARNYHRELRMFRSTQSPQRRVRLTQPFYIGRHEVTQGQFKTVMGKNPAAYTERGAIKELAERVTGLDTTDFPVESVSWNDTADFCNRLSEAEQLSPCFAQAGEARTWIEGSGYRLPTEAEWEFSCRAGTTTRFWSGNTTADLERAGWVYANSAAGSDRKRPEKVGALAANPFGLYDVHGNVNEWVYDGWDEKRHDRAQDGVVIDPLVHPGTLRISRSGPYDCDPPSAASATRAAYGTNYQFCQGGFRVSLSVAAVNAAIANDGVMKSASKTDQQFLVTSRPAKAPFDAAQGRASQEAWAKHLGTEVESTNSVGQKMVLLPPGEFLMGSSDEQVATALKAAADMKADRGVIGRIESSERPQHRVVISKPLRMSATEVTVGQFKRFVAASQYVTEAERYGFGDSGGTALNDKVTETQRQSNWRSPGYTVDDNSPVAQITWNDAVAYCKWLSDQEKITYRLPTEAEWEYACRAGTTTQYSFGDDYKALPKYGWPIENAVIQSHPVGTQLPNTFGLFDMHGNLYEWCSDYFEANWYAASPVSDPIGPISGSNRVLRGGSVHNGPSQCRSASRYSNSPSGRYKDYGFRCVAELQLLADASAKSQTFGSEEWIDVMPLLKPDVDRVDIGRSLVGKNDWRVEDGELRYYGDDKSGKLYFPVRCLGRSLECEFEFTRTAGNISFNTDIPIPDGFVPLTIGNDRIGFVNESLTDKFQIVNGQRTKLRLRVTQAGADDRLEVFVNDQPLVDWKGKLAKHKIVPPRTDARNPSEHFSLFAHGPTNYSFRAIRMRMLNGGSAKSLRPAAANAKPWIDWLGPKVQRGDFDVNPNGWVREGEAVTTEHVISGIEVLPPTTRDGAIRVTYLLRDAKGIAINARDHLMDNDSDFRELYVVEDLRDGLRLAYARAGQQDRSLATQPIGADVSKDLPRTLEFRVVGDTLTVKLNGSLVSTVKDSTIPVGNFALVALKGVLIQKVEYQSLDSLK